MKTFSISLACMAASLIGEAKTPSAGIISHFDFTEKNRCCKPSFFPTEIASFDATVDSRNITCTWITSRENNNNFFELERSADGIHFKTIALVFSADGNSSNRQQYRYKDKKNTTVKGLVFYRLKQVANDGAVNYTEIITVNADADTEKPA